MRIDLTAPMSWADLTPEQLTFVCGLLSGGLTREEVLVAAFCHLCGVKLQRNGDDYWLLNGKERTPIGILAIGDFSSRFSWILDDEPVEPPCPFGIDRYLIDTTFEHYFRADALMLHYSQTNDVPTLCKALKELEVNIEDPTEAQVLATQVWWNGFKRWLKERYPLVFQDDDAGSTEPYNPINARRNIMLMLNDGKPQDNERIEQSNRHDVLAALQHKIDQAKEVEQQMKKYR